MLALKQSDLAIVVVSGRGLAQIKADVAECFSYAVVANGSYVPDQNSRAFPETHPIDKELVLKAIQGTD